MRNALAIATLLLASVGMLSCDDEETTTQDVAAEVDVGDVDDVQSDEADSDESAEEDVGEEGFEFEIEVRIPSEDGDTDVPASGVVVALDMPNGSRVENTTDESGRVPAMLIYWRPEDTMTLTAYLEDYTVSTAVGLTEAQIVELVSEDGVLLVYLQPVALPQESYVEVSGQAINLTNTERMLTVTTTVPGTWHQAKGPDWALSLEPDVPFELVALEWRDLGTNDGYFQELNGWSVVAHEAISEPTTVELDMSVTVEPNPVEVNLVVPEHGLGSFFSNAYPYWMVRSLDSDSLFVGVVDERNPVDGQLDWDLPGEYIELESLENPATLYDLRGSNNELSLVWKTGYPTDGSLELAFPEPPQITSLTGSERLALDDELVWELNSVDLADPDLGVYLQITDVGGNILHMVGMQPGTTTLTIPALPSAVDPSQFYGVVVRGRLLLCVNEEPFEQCARFAGSRFFGIEP